MLDNSDKCRLVRLRAASRARPFAGPGRSERRGKAVITSQPAYRGTDEARRPRPLCPAMFAIGASLYRAIAKRHPATRLRFYETLITPKRAMQKR